MQHLHLQKNLNKEPKTKDDPPLILTCHLPWY